MSDVALVRYDAACRALAEAKAVDEVKKIRDVAEAMRAYARQAKNKQLEIDAAEIRIRAERRVGELIRAQKETVGVSKGGNPKDFVEPSPEKNRLPTYSEALGLPTPEANKLAMRAQALAAVPEKEFEGMAG